MSETNKYPVLSIVDGLKEDYSHPKPCINGITFEHDELQKLKEYLQSIGAEGVFFYSENDEEIEELQEMIAWMGKMSPDASCFSRVVVRVQLII